MGMSVNVCLMLVGGVVNAIGDTRTWQLGRRIGGYARAALASLIMQKVRTQFHGWHEEEQDTYGQAGIYAKRTLVSVSRCLSPLAFPPKVSVYEPLLYLCVSVCAQALRLDVLSEGLVVEGESKEGVGAGELTNLLAVDAQAVLDYLVFGTSFVFVVSCTVLASQEALRSLHT